MSFKSIVHGRIASGNSYKENQHYINSLENDQPFPWIRSEMFGFQNLDRPYFYDQPIITFGATYKQVEDDWTAWLIRFEHILENIDFDTAKIQLETEIYGTFNFFWKSKKYIYGNHDDKHFIDMGLNVGELWYYGYGLRSMWGTLEDDNENISAYRAIFNNVHPYQITSEVLTLFDELKKHLSFGERNYFYDLPGQFTKKQDVLFPLLIKLSLEKKIVFNADDSYSRPDNNKFGPYIILNR